MIKILIKTKTKGSRKVDFSLIQKSMFFPEQHSNLLKVVSSNAEAWIIQFIKGLVENSYIRRCGMSFRGKLELSMRYL